MPSGTVAVAIAPRVSTLVGPNAVADEQPQDQTPDPADNADPDVAPLDGLDDLLADAASLANELAGEVGDPEASDAPAQPSQPTSALDEPPDGLDAKLAELEELARTATAEIGDGNEAPPSDEQQSAPEATEDASSEPEPQTPTDVPAFMGDLMQPAEPEPPAAAEASAAATPPAAEPSVDADSPKPQPPRDRPLPGVINAETIQSLPDLDALPSLDDGTGTDQAPPPGDLPATDKPQPKQDKAPDGAEEKPKDPSEEPATKPRHNPFRHLAARLSTPALAVCERSATALEAVDKPFSKVGDVPRRIIGWFAVATLFVSLIVLIISSL